MNLFVVTLWLVFLACSQEPHCLLSAPALCGLPMPKRLSTAPVYWNFVAAFDNILHPSFAIKLYKLTALYVFDRFTAACCMFRYVVACALINQCCIYAPDMFVKGSTHSASMIGVSALDRTTAEACVLLVEPVNPLTLTAAIWVQL